MTHREIAEKLRNNPNGPTNCGQTVLMTFAEELGLSQEQAKKMGTNFGGGMLCGSTCGTLTSGMMVLGGLGVSPRMSAQFIKRFKELHETTECAVLLAKSREAGIAKKNHCDGLVYDAIDTIDAILKEAGM